MIGEYNYAVCLENGQGVKKDFKKAVEFYKRSSDQGYQDGKTAYERCAALEQGRE
jgi:TPR repeat protein